MHLWVMLSRVHTSHAHAARLHVCLPAPPALGVAAPHQTASRPAAASSHQQGSRQQAAPPAHLGVHGHKHGQAKAVHARLALLRHEHSQCLPLRAAAAAGGQSAPRPPPPREALPGTFQPCGQLHLPWAPCRCCHHPSAQPGPSWGPPPAAGARHRSSSGARQAGRARGGRTQGRGAGRCAVPAAPVGPRARLGWPAARGRQHLSARVGGRRAACLRGRTERSRGPPQMPKQAEQGGVQQCHSLTGRLCSPLAAAGRTRHSCSWAAGRGPAHSQPPPAGHKRGTHASAHAGPSAAETGAKTVEEASDTHICPPRPLHRRSTADQVQPPHGLPRTLTCAAAAAAAAADAATSCSASSFPADRTIGSAGALRVGSAGALRVGSAAALRAGSAAALRAGSAAALRAGSAAALRVGSPAALMSLVRPSASNAGCSAAAAAAAAAAAPSAAAAAAAASCSGVRTSGLLPAFPSLSLASRPFLAEVPISGSWPSRALPVLQMGRAG